MQFIVKNPVVKKDEKKKWLGKSIVNYKQRHEELAKEKGVHAQFMKAPTITAARKILFGK